MANENISKNTQERSVDNGIDKSNPGPYLARVIEHGDPTYVGSLKVQLLKTTEAGNTQSTTGQILEARYASPFYGLTNAQKGPGPNDTYDDAQKSYGFWMIPPDPGSTVLVTFVEGSRDYAYWFACVPERGMTFRLPSTDAATDMTSGPVPGDLKGKRLPTAEYNKKLNRPNTNNILKYKKPVNNEYIDILREQGTIEDDIRGICSTSAQREVPSMVFGFSSPGPLDKRGGKPSAPVGVKENKVEVPVSRLGSSSIFIDDGDDKFLRTGKAKDTPYEYVDAPGGDVTIPHNEMIRLKTRTGAQLLMHTSEDLIYINNSRGTAWLEMTSNGKIDIYADDSISIHSEQDLNIVADRDINLEAGRTININAVENQYNTVGKNMENRVGETYKTSAAKNIELYANEKLNLYGTGGWDGISGTGDMKLQVGQNMEILVGETTKITSGGNLETLTSQDTKITSGGNSHFNSSAQYETANPIHHNGPVASKASAAGSATEATIAISAAFPQRVPQHEPWKGHENWNPPEVTPDKTEAKETSQDVHFADRKGPGDRTPIDGPDMPKIVP